MSTTSVHTTFLRMMPVRRPHRMIERHVVAYRRQWLIVVSGFFEPLFYLLSMRAGLGDLVGNVAVAGKSVPYDAFVAFTEACLRGLLGRAGLTTVAAFHDLDEVFSKGRPTKLRLLAQKKERGEGAGSDPVAALQQLIANLPPVTPRADPLRAEANRP